MGLPEEEKTEEKERKKGRGERKERGRRKEGERREGDREERGRERNRIKVCMCRVGRTWLTFANQKNLGLSLIYILLAFTERGHQDSKLGPSTAKAKKLSLHNSQDQLVCVCEGREGQENEEERGRRGM